MDIALVTGASSALGLAISKRLIQLGFRVYGLGGDYTDCPLQNVNFKPVQCDLADAAAVESACRRILDKEGAVCMVVNNAKFFGRNRFREMDNAELERILRINLLCPLVILRTFAESLKNLQGHIIQLGALSVERSRGGPAGAAASGGLRWMSEQLFQDLRDHGVRVCHISPEPNQSRDPRSAPRPGARTEASIDPEAVAQAVEQLLLSPYGNVVTELVLRPLRQRERDMEPVRRLPSPEPQPIPYTVPREIIDAEEQLEEETYQAQMERKREKRKARRKASGAPEPTAPEPRQTPAPKPAAVQERPAKASTEASPEETPSGDGRSQRSRSRRRRKPRPPMTQVGFVNQKPSSETPVASNLEARPKAEAEVKPKPEPEAKPKHEPQSKSKPADTQTASGKSAPAAEDVPVAAKKAPRKAAARKTAGKVAKKAARKSATKKVARKAPRKTASSEGDSAGKSGKEPA